VYDFHKTAKETVTLRRLHKEAEGQLGFNGRVSGARKLIRELGLSLANSGY
jgi:hypothetical protein